jgi:hypothetical protein
MNNTFENLMNSEDDEDYFNSKTESAILSTETDYSNSNTTLDSSFEPNTSSLNNSESLFPELDEIDLETLKRTALVSVWKLQDKIAFIENECLETDSSDKLNYISNLCIKILDLIPLQKSQ